MFWYSFVSLSSDSPVARNSLFNPVVVSASSDGTYQYDTNQNKDPGGEVEMEDKTEDGHETMEAPSSTFYLRDQIREEPLPRFLRRALSGGMGAVRRLPKGNSQGT